MWSVWKTRVSKAQRRVSTKTDPHLPTRQQRKLHEKNKVASISFFATSSKCPWLSEWSVTLTKATSLLGFCFPMGHCAFKIDLCQQFAFCCQVNICCQISRLSLTPSLTLFFKKHPATKFIVFFLEKTVASAALRLRIGPFSASIHFSEWHRGRVCCPGWGCALCERQKFTHAPHPWTFLDITRRSRVCVCVCERTCQMHFTSNRLYPAGSIAQNVQTNKSSETGWHEAECNYFAMMTWKC